MAGYFTRPAARRSRPTAGEAVLREDLGMGAFMHLLDRSLLSTGAYWPGTAVSGTGLNGRGLNCNSATWYEAATVSQWPATAMQNGGPITIVAVCYPSGIGTDVGRTIVGNTASGTEKGFFLSYENRVAASSPNKMRLLVGNGIAAERDLSFGPTLSAGQRVVVVVSADSLGIYTACNGVSANWARGTTTSGDSTRTLHVGRPNFSSTVIPFDGLIESIAFIPKRFPEAWCRETSLDPYAALLVPRRRIWVPVAAGSGSTGTVAYTNANDTSAASGTTTVVGTLATTNANDTSAASGTTTVTGTLAYTNANDTSAASGTTTVVGTLATTNANDTCVASGTAGAVTGTVAYTNANDTAAASGSGGNAVAATTPTPAGRPARKRNYVVEIDGEDHIVGSVAEARALLDTVQEEAKQAADLAISRAAKATTKPVRKVMHDARKALQVPQITAPKALAPIAEQALTSVQSLYASTMRDIEIAALLKRAQAQEEDDEDVLMLIA